MGAPPTLVLIGVISANGRIGGSVITHTCRPRGVQSRGGWERPGPASQGSQGGVSRGHLLSFLGLECPPTPRPPVRPPCPPQLPSAYCSQSCKGGVGQEGLSSGLRLEWSLQELTPTGPASLLVCMRFCTGSRNSVHVGFPCSKGSPLTHSWDLSPRALAHGYKLDSGPCRVRGHRSVLDAPPCPCVLPKKALLARSLPGLAAPTPGAPEAARG